MAFEDITPGEWWASGVEVGDVPMMNIKICNRVSGETYEQAQANAKLIAAAPELYKCLVGYMQAVEQVQAAMQDGVNVQGAVSNIIGWEDRCKWAIQQAGGPNAD
ncbi:hypothetical protein pEaSNUABM56_00017 [Erwinia phage pEa_SNUABM_56]|uniref:Uncharacterized protein n=1 Tax=Erwinia phage pEp_SNUABM_01 TaxID=2601643 RepID=A0A5J6DB80_9CAUD|nr:hypothetical protein HWC63_gp111 [Erwinia phage pEp_SNUABM_01]QEQ95067.1 hypothetical protein pEpSNUABM01_241 [Erwinia phage pEp_SNUABM_01]UYL84995.1 hypothetical protein pEaSNUABM55_00222 [Erwinia phage pEa_SNUABM_55]UYL85062.1 hypothetical protein pEaSNUABM56_00017 [Erwinia phage pEa_SNUABM_56]